MSLEITLPLALAWAAAAALLLAFLLSSAFLRGRAALAALVLLWAWGGFALATGFPALGFPGTPRLEAVLLFAPLGLLLLAGMVETVLFSRAGAILALLLAVQSAFAYLLPGPWWDALWALERLPSRWLGEAFAARAAANLIISY